MAKLGSSIVETKPIHVLAGKLFDSVHAEFLSNQLIIVSQYTGRITSVKHYQGHEHVDINLSHLTVLPGFVDAHVHCTFFNVTNLGDPDCNLVFLHSYGEASWTDQLTKESLVERTVRATNHARDTLMAGFTTVR
jgi:imidazolonepropionase-like amidohydrolase